MSKSFIGAFFQCYKNPFATYKALESFREHYPDSPIVLLSDNGYNYKKMAEYFNCKYIHAIDNVPVWISYINDEQYIKKGRQLIDRVCNAFKEIDCEYVLLLEDDVKIQNSVDKILLQEKDDLYGFNPNSISRELMSIFKEKYQFIDVNRDYKYSGHGGSLYKRESCIKYFSNNQVVDDVLNAFRDYRGIHLPTNMNQDQLLSLIIMLNDGKINQLPGHVDYHYSDFKDCLIQHQYKIFYNKPMLQELKHLVEFS